MAYQAVARLEREDREPTWPTVLKLASALGVSTAAFEQQQPAADPPADDPDRPPRISKRK